MYSSKFHWMAKRSLLLSVLCLALFPCQQSFGQSEASDVPSLTTAEVTEILTNRKWVRYAYRTSTVFSFLKNGELRADGGESDWKSFEVNNETVTINSLKEKLSFSLCSRNPYILNCRSGKKHYTFVEILGGTSLGMKPTRSVDELKTLLTSRKWSRHGWGQGNKTFSFQKGGTLKDAEEASKWVGYSLNDEVLTIDATGQKNGNFVLLTDEPNTFVSTNLSEKVIFVENRDTIVYGPSRTFTNKDGNQITAEVTGISDGKVSVVKDEKPFQISISTLIDDDISYLKDYLKKNPTYSVRIAIFPQEGMAKLVGSTRIKGRLGEGGGSMTSTNLSKDRKQTTTSTKQEHLMISLTNDSTAPLVDLSVEYKVYITELKDTGFSGANTRTYSKKGVIEVPELGIGETCKVWTETIKLENKTSATKQVTTTEYTDGTSSSISKVRRNRIRPESQGIWIRVKEGDTIIEDYKKLSDSIKKESLSW